MSWQHHREYVVSRGKDGHQLDVRDRWLPGVFAEAASIAVLAVLGHPCCGRGPLGRIPVLDVTWWRIMQWGTGYARKDRLVLSLPLTVAQAAALRPDLADDLIMFPPDGTDDCGYTWHEGRMVGTPSGSADERAS